MEKEINVNENLMKENIKFENIKNEKKSLISSILMNSKLYPIYSFILTSVLMLVTFKLVDIIGNNNKSIFIGDLMQQYVAFISDFFRMIDGEGSFWYSFANYVGSGNVLTNAYYCFSPFNIIIYLLGDNYQLSTIIVIIAKISFASSTFCFFICRFLKKNNPFFVLMSLFYGMSGYVVSMYFNIMWIDAIYMLPIIIYLVVRLIDEGKFIGLCLTYAYVFVTNFYMAYMVGIFSACFFIMYLLYSNNYVIKGNVKKYLSICFKYFISVIVAVGLCAFLLLSTAGFLSEHMADDNFEFSMLIVNLLDMINAMFIGEMMTLDNKVPFLYCGIPTFALAILFFMDSINGLKIKLFYGIQILIFTFCMIFLPAYKFMHAFDYPNYYGFRFSFVLIFLFLVMACIEIDNISKDKLKYFKLFVLISLMFYSFMMTFQKIQYATDAVINSQNGLVINAIFIFAWFFILLFYLYKFHNISIVKKRIFNFILVGVVAVEILVNNYLCITHLNFYAVEDDHYNQWFYSSRDAINEIKANDDSFYRVYINNDICNNTGKWLGFNSVNTFSSADNSKLRLVLSRLGVQTCNRGISTHCIIPVFDSLFGVKYRVDVPEYEKWKDLGVTKNNYLQAEYQKNDNVLSLGYMVSDKVLDVEFIDNSFDNLENLSNAMVNMNEDIFENIKYEDMEMEENNYDVNHLEDYIVYTRKSSVINDGWVSYGLEKKDDSSDYYVEFFHKAPSCNLLSPEVLTKEKGYSYYTYASEGGIYKLSEDENGIKAVVLYCGDLNDFYLEKINFAKYNPDAYEKVYNELSKNQYNITENTGDFISGTIVATEEKNLMMTTIPYDPEWTVYVDGKPATQYLVYGDAFLGVKLTPGEHVVSFQYVEKYSVYGAIISFVSMIIFALLVVVNILKKK